MFALKHKALSLARSKQYSKVRLVDLALKPPLARVHVSLVNLSTVTFALFTAL